MSRLINLPTTEQNERSRKVREMFGAIAARYDFLNHFLSANIDRRWRKICVREIRNKIAISRPKILDVGCGTADLSLAFSQLGTVVGCDFCHPMLRIGQGKVARGGANHRVHLLGGDALALPFNDATFEVVVSAFVLRNLVDAEQGLREMYRVLRPQGVLGVLEFGIPEVPLLGALYRFYFTRVLPRLGKAISGMEGPYKYLPTSVQSWPPARELRETIVRAGFGQVEYRLLNTGIAVLFVGIVEA